MRIDKYLWCVRLFKNRSLAVAACKKGQILVDESICKPSRNLAGGEIIKIKKNPIWRVYRVKELLKNRVAASLVADYLEEITPYEDLQKLQKVKLETYGQRERGAGRPTKKERRDIDKFLGE